MSAQEAISQGQFGFEAGIHRIYTSLIERGTKSRTLGVLFRLCRPEDVPGLDRLSLDWRLTYRE